MSKSSKVVSRTVSSVLQPGKSVSKVQPGDHLSALEVLNSSLSNLRLAAAQKALRSSSEGTLRLASIVDGITKQLVELKMPD